MFIMIAQLFLTLDNLWIGMMAHQFQVNEEVEIIGAEKGLVGSFHSGIIVKKLPMEGFFLVQYDFLRNDDNTGPLKQIKSCGFLRPFPPPNQKPSYNVGDHVDLWSRDGWWYGIVQGRPMPDMYHINFTMFDYPSVIAPVEDIRRHVHWNGYTWEQPSNNLIPVD